MKKLGRYCRFDISPYLSKDVDCTTYLTFKEETVEFVEKYFKKLNISEFTVKSEEVEIGEELSLYHQFVNGLLLLDALHAVWLKVANVVGIINCYINI